MALIILSGCASSGANAVRKLTYVPPQLIDTSGPVFDTPAGIKGYQFDITFDVMVDEQGHADMSTFHAVGSGASANDAAIRQWMSTAHFRPATEDGQPRRGKYGQTIMSRVVIR
jgi:hypothetical protein